MHFLGADQDLVRQSEGIVDNLVVRRRRFAMYGVRLTRQSVDEAHRPVLREEERVAFRHVGPVNKHIFLMKPLPRVSIRLLLQLENSIRSVRAHSDTLIVLRWTYVGGFAADGDCRAF